MCGAPKAVAADILPLVILPADGKLFQHNLQALEAQPRHIQGKPPTNTSASGNESAAGSLISLYVHILIYAHPYIYAGPTVIVNFAEPAVFKARAKLEAFIRAAFIRADRKRGPKAQK